eukprot:5351896-Prymnesium_polylepis.1
MAFEAGVGGPGYLWVGSDTMVDSGLWESDEALATNVSLRQHVLKGFFAIAPDGKSQGAATYGRYLARRRQLPDASGQ